MTCQCEDMSVHRVSALSVHNDCVEDMSVHRVSAFCVHNDCVAQQRFK